jgi:hypothetical protein
MRNLLLFMLLVGIFVIGSRSCNGFHLGFGGISGTGPVQTETRAVQNFHGIHIDMSADAEVSIGEQYLVEVAAQQNLLPIIQTKEENGILRIFSSDNFNTSEPIKIRITLPALDQLNVSGSGAVKVITGLTAESFNINIGGSGEVSCMQCTFGKLETSISGSGEITLGGKCNDWRADISGSGEALAKSFTSNTLDVSISGSGSVTADVTTVLNAQVSGSGDVFYTGSPTVNSSVSGSGAVKKLEAQ